MSNLAPVIENSTRGYSSSATFTPAAASHTNGDVVGGAKEFANIGPATGHVVLKSVTLLIENATIETTAWALHLYNVTPPSAIADDAALTFGSGDRAAYLGFIAISQVVDYGDTLWIEDRGINKYLKLAGSSLFGYLVNGTTLTPGAVAHTVTLFAEAV